MPSLTAATGLLALALSFGGTLRLSWRPDATAALLVLGVVGTGLAYVLNYRIETVQRGKPSLLHLR